jgi:dTDP-4-dehydrorhamnose reductase
MGKQTQVLIIGGSGLLGQAMIAECRRHDRPLLAPGKAELDLEEQGAVDSWLERSMPAAVINAVGYTDVIRAELPANRDEAMRLNRDAPSRLAQICARRGLPLIHISTDYVFDGRKNAPYREQDPVAPLQVYGESKLKGEQAVLSEHPDALVIRTSTLFGPGLRGRRHYVDAVLAQACSGQRLELVRLPVSSPTFAPDLAGALLRLLDVRATGVVHVVNRGSCSRIELAQESMRLAGERHRAEIAERPEDPDGPARPPYSVLDCSRYTALTREKMRTWPEALAVYLKAHRP